MSDERVVHFHDRGKVRIETRIDLHALFYDAKRKDQARLKGGPDKPTNYWAWSGGLRDTSMFTTIERLVPEIDELWPVATWHSLLFVLLEPGGWMHEHTDDNPWGRHHIVIETNEKVVCVNGGVEQHLERGHIYDMDKGLPHSARNEGHTDRLHLVVLTE